MHSSFSWPPRQAVRLAVVLVLLLGLAALVAGVVGGAVAALGVLFGAVVGLGAGLSAVGWGWRLALAAVAALAAVFGSMASGAPVLAGLVVGLSGLAQVPFTVRGARLAMLLPVVPALTASVDLSDRSVAFAAWLAVGVVTIALLALALRVSGEPQPTPRGEAVRHAVATAVVGGVGLGVARALEIGHGYWLVIAVASVLAVSRDATAREATERVAGTLSGAVLAIVLVAVLPLWATLAVAAVLMVLSVAWGVAHEVRLAAASASAVVVLLGSGGLVGSGAGLAAERLVLTLVGAALATGTVALLWRLDRSDRARA